MDTDLVRLMFCSTLLCTEKGSKNDLKRPILQLSNKIKTIVELTIVEHPNVPLTLWIDITKSLKTNRKRENKSLK